MSVSLLDEVRTLLLTRPANVTYAEISEKTNLSIHDLKRLASGRAGGMPTGKVQAAYEGLTGKPLIANPTVVYYAVHWPNPAEQG